uniref:HAT C-terminal dimerisation domain-containing protein n=1 Tax=Amphimedon queenslandica TaxID=400682 RepID=A0A1X7VK73_AMPQE
MVDRILEQEEAIRRTLSSDWETSHLVPTWQDIDVLQAIHTVLSPLSSLTDILSADSYVTVSAVIPFLHLIDKKFLKKESIDTQLTHDIKKHIRDDLNERYSNRGKDIKVILKTAMFLDPQFKTKYLNEQENEIEDMKLFITDNSPDIEVASQSQSENSCDQPPAQRRCIGSLFKDNEETDVMPEISKEQYINNELDRYISSPKLDFEEDPLSYWKDVHKTYPYLSNLVKRYMYLCVCATSSSSERLFSASGNIVTPCRSSLKPEKVHMLTFLNKNLE